MNKPISKIRGRGTSSRIDGRYLEHTRQVVDDGWMIPETLNPIKTQVMVERPKTIISRNQSPDIPFELSINPYRGCEHGCVYCFARPTHAYLDLSPGLDFETRLFAKPNAAELLEKEITKPGYQCSTIALGTNTDPYQPIERKWKITRRIIEVLNKYEHPLTIVTKSWLVERDIDLLAPMAAKELVQVFVSVTSLDARLAGKLEPRATAPARRLQTLQRLGEAGIPTGVMFAPVIPALNDCEMETILQQASEVAVLSAGYIMLRLPHEIKQLFREWLETHEPLKTDHVMNIIRDLRGGKENDPGFGSRMRGQGAYAALIKQRFENMCKRLGLNQKKIVLDTARFKGVCYPVKQIKLL